MLAPRYGRGSSAVVAVMCSIASLIAALTGSIDRLARLRLSIADLILGAGWVVQLCYYRRVNGGTVTPADIVQCLLAGSPSFIESGSNHFQSQCLNNVFIDRHAISLLHTPNNPSSSSFGVISGPPAATLAWRT